MQDSVHRIIGSIALCWNAADDAIARIATLYLDIDQPVYDIMVRPLRPQDREELLKKAAAVKEFDDAVRAEIREALSRAKTCRENRNIVIHNLGGIEGDLTEPSQRILERALADMMRSGEYLRQLHDAVSALLLERSAREVPEYEGGTGEDEVGPLAVFVPPERPGKPRKLRLEDIQTVRQDGNVAAT